jgi:alpha-amylase/alpha-mannosidase (GH57 family)
MSMGFGSAGGSWTDRYACIHGHFYQPPRENPWLEAIELQDSAYPYHDWNERITAECYAPNGASRILDADGKITSIVNNYSRISFNFGPTLLAWMEEKSPAVYESILAADRESGERFSGHGSAMAQAYNHIILPLAAGRDKKTQVLWGIRDFQHRFHRKPEGLWLPETAVDLESLEILAAAGIKFTVLSPYQASQVRPIGGRSWRDVSGGGIDPSTAYRISLPNRRSIAVFFYDGPISRAIAFEDLLSRGENLAHRLCSAFSEERERTQLVHIATDGETYGHHKAHGDMALAYALERIEVSGSVRLTNYAEFLEKNPPAHEARIFERSSWSCVHGVERWAADCGCNSGMRPGWRQGWRGPLREALDWLRDELAREFDRQGDGLFQNPWTARDEYISVVLDRSPESVDRFLTAHASRRLAPEEQVRALKLMELQRHAMLMYTSCGWFFDELSGIETVQILQYAARALQLSEELSGKPLEEEFVSRLEQAKSNLPEHRDGKLIYEKFVKPAIVDLHKVGAHYAISSLFEDFAERSRIYAFDVDREDFYSGHEGRGRIALGRAKIASHLTRESSTVSFGALHLGDQNISGGIREYQGEEAYEALTAEIKELFGRGDVPELVRAVDRNFGAGAYSLRSLFRDEQRKIVNLIMENALQEAESLYRNFYSHYSTLARFVRELEIPLPHRFLMAVDFTLHEDLLAALSAAEPDAKRVEALLDQLRRLGIPLDNVTLEFAFRKTVERAATEYEADPFDAERVKRFHDVVSLSPSLPFPTNLWTAQNTYHRARRAYLRALEGPAAPAQSEAFRLALDALGAKLGFQIEVLAATGAGGDASALPQL